jgi:hypothetical protein
MIELVKYCIEACLGLIFSREFVAGENKQNKQ